MADDHRTMQFFLTEAHDEILELELAPGQSLDSAHWMTEPELLMEEDGTLVHRESLPPEASDADA